MLVLKRKVGESLMIGEDVEISILEKDGDAIKIGIKAPRSVRVYRKEIYEEIKLANQQAMATPGADLLRQLLQLAIKNNEKS